MISQSLNRTFAACDRCKYVITLGTRYRHAVRCVEVIVYRRGDAKGFEACRVAVERGITNQTICECQRVAAAACKGEICAVALSAAQCRRVNGDRFVFLVNREPRAHAVVRSIGKVEVDKGIIWSAVIHAVICKGQCFCRIMESNLSVVVSVAGCLGTRESVNVSVG